MVRRDLIMFDYLSATVVLHLIALAFILEISRPAKIVLYLVFPCTLMPDALDPPLTVG